MVNFYYDPIRSGYTTASFVTTKGTPAVSTTYLRFNAASAVHVGNIYKCDMSIKAIIPAVPTTGDVRFIGFSNLGLGAKIGFDITDDVFSAVATDIKGNTTSKFIDFDADWAAAETIYEIRWIGVEVYFLVNGQQLAKFNDVAVPKTSLSLFIDNENSDNMDISGVDFKDIESYK